MAGLREAFIQNLRYYRKKKGLRQLDLAMELGRSANYINSIENGKYFPSPETIEQISAVLEIEPLRLFDDQAQKQTAASVADLQEIERRLQETISADIKTIFAI